MTKKPSKVDEAKELLNKERNDRSKRVGEKIQQVLKEENCVIDPIVQFSENAGAVPVRAVLHGKIGLDIIAQ